MHEMKIMPEYYNYILNGTKKIEIRLFDEKRQKIKIGDTIVFKKAPDFNEIFKSEVTNLLHYESFDDIFNDFDISVLADFSKTKSEVIKELNTFYTKEEQKKYGVIGIEIKVIK